jgi:alkylation response protein AidB-like acyl-CoA dehydrogenase
MQIDYTPEQKAVRTEIRAYFDALMTPELRAGMRFMEGGEQMRALVKQIGTDGWLGVGWPKEYGGRGMTGVEQQIFAEEARRAGAPLPFVTLNTVGPALIDYGTEEQKQKFLPMILAGDVHFAIGYSEPEAGTDLASLQTRALRVGDEYVINGTKMFTSGAGNADYVWLACRTDPDVKKHKGISIIIVDTKQAGYTHAPIETVGGGATAMSYYEDVRAPVDMCVGGENNGWSVLTAQLNHERMGLAAFGMVARRVLRDAVEWATDTESESGTRVVDKPWVQGALAEAHCLLEAMKVMNWRMAWELETSGNLHPARASAAKVYGTECVIDAYRLILEVLGVSGILRPGSPGAILQGEVEQEYRMCQINTFGGGVAEVQREIVAMLGMRMPRTVR